MPRELVKSETQYRDIAEIAFQKNGIAEKRRRAMRVKRDCPREKKKLVTVKRHDNRGVIDNSLICALHSLSSLSAVRMSNICVPEVTKDWPGFPSWLRYHRSFNFASVNTVYRYLTYYTKHRIWRSSIGAAPQQYRRPTALSLFRNILDIEMNVLNHSYRKRGWRSIECI